MIKESARRGQLGGGKRFSLDYIFDEPGITAHLQNHKYWKNIDHAEYLFDFTSYYKDYFRMYKLASPIETVSNFWLSVKTGITRIHLSQFVFGTYQLNFDLVFDSLTYVLIIIILLIGTAVHFFSLHYMKNDPHIIRFLAYISLFLFFMMLLVASSNLVLFYFA